MAVDEAPGGAKWQCRDAEQATQVLDRENADADVFYRLEGLSGLDGPVRELRAERGHGLNHKA